MYKLLLRDIHNTAKKLGTVTSTLEKALQITQDVPKRANDAMTLSMIYDYDGNIHKHGQIILQVGVVFGSQTSDYSMVGCGFKL